MAQIDPRMLLAAAMAQGGGSAAGAPTDQMPQGGPAAAAAAQPTQPGGASPIPMSGPDFLPGNGPSAQPTGADAQGIAGQSGTGSLSNSDLANVVGTGTDTSGDQAAIQQMVAALQDPSTPPDQRAQIQMRLQLAALQAAAGGASGAVGAPTG